MSQAAMADFGMDSFASMFEESLQRSNMRAGEVISAEVVRIEHNFVVVNAGLKSEAYVPLEEFKNDKGELEVQVGDFVSVAIDAIENGYGDTILSRDKAKRLASWLSLETALESGDFVTGTVSGKVKGGLTVLVNGIRAFLPGSLLDTRPVKDMSPYEGKTMEFKVIKLDRKRNNVVLSRRAVVEASMGEERAKLLETLREGAFVNGVVKNITEYGAFVDLGGIDGLLHITDMAWRRVRHPSEVVTVGQELTAKVLKFDAEKNRVSLGLKQMGDDPWYGVSRRYPSSTRLFGKVTNIADYGAFVEIEPGIEGLVHVSEMDWTNKNVAPSKIVALGDEVEVMVLEIDEDKRRISLGMKQCRANPWDEFAQNFKRGDKVKGPVKSITDFGVFVGLAAGIDGLVHLSDLSWNETGEAAVRNFKKGQEVEAVVLGIDVERERISLGIKQLDADPFTNYTSINDRGMTVTGKVKTVDARGAEIQLSDEVTGYLRASELARERVEDARNLLKEGDDVSAMIINIDRKTRSIQLSIKAKDSIEQQEALQRLSVDNRETVGNAGTTSLGALLKAKLDQGN
ncbi:30S ribosomal protein S1 [Sphaerotilus montanus]|uniref:30S ribosomal protein S1 n=1 Tax=Sphaerotilus montanus TaxID=522889 RepID=A0A7Y9QYK9_9BURK|nr:30S ribosomal protein S1 [Sphaerotilus montanus]NYG31622.1 small subunit ribosomal protein S1 [Sphaerotilus montanus]NZD58464.1 30S ribosomal protein S1 [Sphaerotilus montanus]